MKPHLGRSGRVAGRFLGRYPCLLGTSVLVAATPYLLRVHIPQFPYLHRELLVASRCVIFVIEREKGGSVRA